MNEKDKNVLHFKCDRGKKTFWKLWGWKNFVCEVDGNIFKTKQHAKTSETIQHNTTLSVGLNKETKE